MAWIIKYDKAISKKLKSIDKTSALKIVNFLQQKVASSHNPREHGKALQGSLRKYWRYRVGDYRIICEIQDHIITIFVVDLGHRKEIYKKLKL